MHKIILPGLLLVSLVSIAWFGVSEDMRNAAQSHITALLDAPKESLKDTVKEAIIPEDPKEQREIIIQELKDTVTGIKYKSAIASGNITEEELYDFLRDAAGETAASTTLTRIREQSLDDLVDDTEDLLKDLEELNEKDSLPHELTEAAVKKLLEDSTTIDCEQLCPAPAQSTQ